LRDESLGHAHAIASRGFSAQQRLIRALDQCPQVLGLLCDLGNAATDRHANCAPVDCPSHRFDRVANAPGNFGGSRPIRFRQKYNEFFAAVAAENVQVPRVFTTPLGNATQNLIADSVAVINETVFHANTFSGDA